MDRKPANLDSTPTQPRPLSPNIQIYRPQLTSVLSIAALAPWASSYG
jgi:hypothetical protein